MNENNAPSAVRAAQRLAEPPAEWLDELLAEPHAAPPGLAGRILDQLPPQSRWQGLFGWLTPEVRDVAWWRPAAAALAPLLFGFALGLGVGEPGEESLYDDVLLLAFTEGYFETPAETPAQGGEGND